MKVEVLFGSNNAHFHVTKGDTVKQILSSVEIKEEIGYGNVKDNLMMIIDGKQVDGDQVVLDGQTIELIRPAGEKAL